MSLVNADQNTRAVADDYDLCIRSPFVGEKDTYCDEADPESVNLTRLTSFHVI